MRGWRLFVLGRVSKGIAGVTDRAAGQLPTVPLPGSLGLRLLCLTLAVQTFWSQGDRACHLSS